jgi:hypothetical protein
MLMNKSLNHQGAKPRRDVANSLFILVFLWLGGLAVYNSPQAQFLWFSLYLQP